MIEAFEEIPGTETESDMQNDATSDRLKSVELETKEQKQETSLLDAIAD